MKKVILSAVVLGSLALISCKKDRVCSCKVVQTTTTAGQSHDVVTDYKYTIVGATRKTAFNSRCIHTKDHSEVGNTTYDTDTNCSLE